MNFDFEPRYAVAVSSRILGMQGLMRESTGHVSARVKGEDAMWVRCRGGNERGLTYTDRANIRKLDFDGNGAGDGYASPNEVHIHGELYRARPDVNAIVHAHPYYALLCGVTNLEYLPVFGGFEPAALDIVLKGVPVYPRAATVTDKTMAAEMIRYMEDRDVLLMKGHGITVTASSIEDATALAIRFDRLSRIMWDLKTSGLSADTIPDEDIARYDKRLPGKKDKTDWKKKLGTTANFAWNYYVSELETSGPGLPEQTTDPE